MEKPKTHTHTTHTHTPQLRKSHDDFESLTYVVHGLVHVQGRGCPFHSREASIRVALNNPNLHHASFAHVSEFPFADGRGSAEAASAYTFPLGVIESGVED